MSERIYNRLANILMLIGIASALLFDSGRLPRVVVGTIGIVAGVAAMALYFWNQHQSEAKGKLSLKAKAPVGSIAEPNTEISSAKNSVVVRDEVALKAFDTWRNVADVWKVTRDTNFHAIEAYRRDTARLWLSYYAANHARTLRWRVVKDPSLALMQPEVELSPNEVAACAIEIINNLAIADDLKEWEYVFGAKGLRVSVRKAHSFRSEVPQQDFDFEPISSVVQ
jgi:hypothetical protein